MLCTSRNKHKGAQYPDDHFEIEKFMANLVVLYLYRKQISAIHAVNLVNIFIGKIGYFDIVIIQ